MNRERISARHTDNISGLEIQRVSDLIAWNGSSRRLYQSSHSDQGSTSLQTLTTHCSLCGSFLTWRTSWTHNIIANGITAKVILILDNTSFSHRQSLVCVSPAIYWFFLQCDNNGKFFLINFSLKPRLITLQFLLSSQFPLWLIYRHIVLFMLYMLYM